MKIDLYEQLGYLETRELWELMKILGVRYCDISDAEIENKQTGEMVTIPRFTPRTDYDGMKSDIVLAWNKLNRENRRELKKWLDKVTRLRMKCAPPTDSHNPTENRVDEE